VSPNPDPPGLERLTPDQLKPGCLIWSFKANGRRGGWDVVTRVARKPGISPSRPWRVWTKDGGEHYFAPDEQMGAYPGGKLPPTPDYLAGGGDADGPWW
jgi:hypothetical protein